MFIRRKSIDKILRPMKRTYITHVTRDYLEVALNLAKSIRLFSKIPMIVYCVNLEGEDQNKFLGIEDIYIRNIELDISEGTENDYSIEESGNFYINRGSSRIYKILSAKTIAMEMALREGWEDVCYLDSDCLATPLVDELFEWSSTIKDYPIATEGIHDYMIILKDGVQMGNPFEGTWPAADNTKCLEWPLMSFLGVSPHERGRYRTTGIMLMNQNCLSFIKTWRELCFILPKLVNLEKYAPYHEETVYNVLSWKKSNEGFPLCYINLVEGLETVKHAYSEESKAGDLRWDDTDHSKRFYAIPGDKKHIKVLHGEKRKSEVEKILDFLLDLEKKETPKVLIQIDTYPDTRDKIEITKLCIKSLKPLGYPILISSHIEIPEELKEMCEYSYSDGLNILLEPKGDVNYFNYYNQDFHMSFKIEDIDSHSPSVITSWINGSKFSKENGFDYFLKVEYDFVLDPDYETKLKDSINNSLGKMGFVLLSDDYIVPKCIFIKSGEVEKIFSNGIRNPEDYFKMCRSMEVPPGTMRMAGTVKYYALKKYLDQINKYPSENENYFKCTVPEELQRSFPGFFSPLLGSDDSLYLCSYGMTSNKLIRYDLYESGKKIKSGEVNLSNGVFSYSKVDFIGKNYTLVWWIDDEEKEISFTDSDISDEKYGKMNFNIQ